MKLKNISNCTDCGKKFGLFRWRHSCSFCGKILCSSCLHSFPAFPYLTDDFQEKYQNISYCKICWQRNGQPICDSYNSAINIYDKVMIFSATYRGQIPIIKGSTQENIRTPYFRNKTDAETIMKVTAAFLGCDLVYNVFWSKETDSETSDSGKGTYYYSVWSVRGIPAKSKIKK
jgi:hypothetical protein